MADIISLSHKIQNRNEEKAIAVKERFRSFQKSLKRQRTGVRCEKCDAPDLPVNDETANSNPDRNHLLPYKFCMTCATEYVDYIDFLRGSKNTDCHWQNRQWAETWKRWIDYRGALDSYLTSKEFLDSTQALEQAEPEK